MRCGLAGYTVNLGADCHPTEGFLSTWREVTYSSILFSLARLPAASKLLLADGLLYVLDLGLSLSVVAIT